MPIQSYWILLSAHHITETYIPPEGDQWHYEISPDAFIKKGDIVYLWSNIIQGFFGWGEVSQHPRVALESEKADKPSRKRQLLIVNRKKSFEPPLTHQIMLRSRSLKKLIPLGYDDLYAIELRPGQANYINDFVKQHGLEPPIGSEIVNITLEDIEPQLSVKTLLTFKEKTDEGKLIEAVNTPWFDILDILIKDPKAAFEIGPDKWEEIIAGAYHQSGFEVTLTPRSGDFGRDVIAVKKGFGSVRIVDQVKAYKPSLLVTANDVRALGFVLNEDNAAKGFVTTTSDFAPRIKDDPFISRLIPSRLELVNGEKLIKNLTELRKK